MPRSLRNITLLTSFFLSTLSLSTATSPAQAAPPRIDREETCDILVVGGGLAGAATAYEGLLAGKTVCMTEITDWVGGQISTQGTSALDERPTQRSLLFYPRGYLDLRSRIEDRYDRLNPGACWVSDSCFMPYDGHKLLYKALRNAEKQGKGTLKWLPSTVIKDLEYNSSGNLITGAIAIGHTPAPGTAPLNTEPLSQKIDDAFTYDNSARFHKTIVRLSAPKTNSNATPAWYVVDATETGELIGLADLPHRLGVDPRSHKEPSSSSVEGNPYCTQGFTYTFAMQATRDPQEHQLPAFYSQYSPYYSYELSRLANFPLVFSYRRIKSVDPDDGLRPNPRENPILPGDISMQNWTWGNDYRPGSATDNLIYTREQLTQLGQLEPGGWMGGLRTETLRRGEEHAIGYFYWLVAGDTDSQLGPGVKQPYPNHRFLTGLDSPMGTVHGLSKYPYMREGRRIIGRRDWNNPDGFMVWEIDISRQDYRKPVYNELLIPEEYQRLWVALSGLELFEVLEGERPIEEVKRRSRSSIFPDSVGIGHYAIDFHPCMQQSPPEAPGNKEMPGERLGQGEAYPFQIPLRAMIPQKLDNLLVAGKSIATSHTAAAAYRVHSFEWSAGAAAGTTASFALETGVMPYQLVDNLPFSEPQLYELQRRLEQNGNPIAFPNTSIFNEGWDTWKDEK
jgi:FAD dependent oxidoreductase